MLKINRENLRNSHEGPWLLVDLIMLAVLFVNLAWLIFDSLFSTSAVYNLLFNWFPAFTRGYETIHENFLLVDLVFIGIFLTEFSVRWIVSIKRKEHVRWYFFPFIHWYDIVGMIPLGATRIFRFLRIISILYRLHKYKIIDLNQTAVFRFVTFYYDVIVEELSDRIVVKVLNDAQKDIAAGSPLIDDITHTVLAPRQTIVTQWLASMLNHLGNSIHDSEHGEIIRNHVRNSVGKAVRENAEVSTLSLVPVLGRTIENTLESAVTDIVNTSLVNLLSDVKPSDIDTFIRSGLTDFNQAEKALDNEMLLVVNECLELIKEHIAQQRWKAQLEERDMDKHADKEDNRVEESGT